MRPSIKTFLATALIVAGVSAAAVSAGDRPSSYVVKRGDTLWDISARFLGKPWHWPHIWQANPQVKNPHLIYPGDVLSLTDRFSVVAGDRIAAPIPGIALGDVEAFLKDLRLIDDAANAPRVVALEDGRLRVGEVDKRVYFTGNGAFQPGQSYDIVRPTYRYIRKQDRNGVSVFAEDLDEQGLVAGTTGGDWGAGRSIDAKWSSGREVLAAEGRVMATGLIARAPGGEAGILALAGGGMEVRKGDLLVPTPARGYDLMFYPHPPINMPQDGRVRVLSVVDRHVLGGVRDVIAISGGLREGLDPGTTLSIWQDGGNSGSQVIPEKGGVDLPDEFAGHVLIFRSYQNISYGLIMNNTRQVHVGQELKHPDAE